MKNIKYILFCFAALTFSSCCSLNWPFGENSTYGNFWYLENTTAQDLYIQANESKNKALISKGESIIYITINVLSPEDFDFNLLIENKPNLNYFKIFVNENDEEPVRVWRIEDKDEPGKQFFKESSWQIEQNEYDKTWTFVIVPSDLE